MSRICPSCGLAIPDSAQAFCGGCGAALAANGSAAPGGASGPTEAPDSKKPGCAAGVAVGLGAIALVALVLWIGSRILVDRAEPGRPVATTPDVPDPTLFGNFETEGGVRPAYIPKLLQPYIEIKYLGPEPLENVEIVLTLENPPNRASTHLETHRYETWKVGETKSIKREMESVVRAATFHWVGKAKAGRETVQLSGGFGGYR